MSNDINEKAAALLTATPAMGRVQLARLLGIKETQAQGLVERFRKGKLNNSAPTMTQTRFKKAVCAETFRRQFDVPLKIREAMKELSDQVIADNDFRLELGVQSVQWAAARSGAEFQPNQVTIHGKIFWAPVSIIKKIRETIDIS